MDLHALRCFVAVAEEGSVTRAAVRLHMTQPPLSVRLQSLERELDVSLLVRHGRGVEPTVAGHLLLARARRILADVRIVAEEVREVGNGSRGRLVVAVPRTLAPGVLVDLLRQMAADAPDVTLDVLELSGDDAAPAVGHGEASAGLVHLPPITSPRAGRGSGGIEVAVVGREPLVVVLPAEHPAAADPLPLSSGRLRDEVLVVPSRAASSALRAHALAAWGAEESGTRMREVTSAAVAMALVRAGAGVTVLPSSVRSILWEGLVARSLVGRATTVETAAVWRSGSESPVLRRFLRLALSAPEPDALGGPHARADHDVHD